MKDIAIAQRMGGLEPNLALLRIEAARAAATAPDVVGDLADTVHVVTELLEAGAVLHEVIDQVWRSAFIVGFLDGAAYEALRAQAERIARLRQRTALEVAA